VVFSPLENRLRLRYHGASTYAPGIGRGAGCSPGAKAEGPAAITPGSLAHQASAVVDG